MIHYRRISGGALAMCVVLANAAAAQPLGTFRWQLQPFCNVVTVAITQNGAVYRLEGTDDQCGASGGAASVTGTAFPNADGTIGFGLNVVTAPGGRPLHVDAKITAGTFNGSWRDSEGATGNYVLTPGAGSGGSPRPLPRPSVPPAIQLRADGGFVANGISGVGVIPATGEGIRMMWYPGKAAFRAGVAAGAKWDDVNVGPSSAAFGYGTTASGDFSTAMGFSTAASGVRSTALGTRTTASGLASTAMGSGATASGSVGTAMGFSTAASGLVSTAMGSLTTASGSTSTAMGDSTTASGDASFAGGIGSVSAGVVALAFGANVRADGNGSVALGTNSVAASNGSFVFADRSIVTQVRTLAPNQFLVRATGGVEFYSNAAATLGVRLAPDGAQWLALSDVRTKHRFRALDGDEVLAKIAALPVTEWSYTAQDAAIRHIGPTAQDFHAAFGLGEDPLRIGTLDADGVALAGVKAVEARTRRLSERLAALETENAGLQAALDGARARETTLSNDHAAIRDRLARLERLLGKQ